MTPYAPDPATGFGGNQNLCHPFCDGQCYFPFNWRYCGGDACRGGAGDFLISPPLNTAVGPGGNGDWWDRQTSPPRDVVRSHPPQCTPDIWDNLGSVWQPFHSHKDIVNNNFNDGWFDKTSNQDTNVNPNVAVPLVVAPPVMDTLIDAVVPGTAPPPFAPVPHNQTVVNSTVITNPIRTENDEWWKWWLLFLALLLLLGVLLAALCCGPKQRVRQPIKRVAEEVPMVIEERVEVQKPREVVVEEKIYKPTQKQVVIEKKPMKRVEEQVVVKEKLGFNPYKQKNVDFRL